MGSEVQRFKVWRIRVQGSEGMEIIVNPNGVKNSDCRVGCAHQKALNLKVEGGHSPPYNCQFTS